MEIFLEPANIDDWKEVKEIEQKVSNRLFFSFTKEEQFINYLKNSKVFFIEAEGKRVGTISYEVKDDYVEIDSYTLLSDYRGKGIAKEALKQILEKIGPATVKLFTHPENTPAIINYLKAGFVIKGWENDHFGDGEPRLLLVRKTGLGID